MSLFTEGLGTKCSPASVRPPSPCTLRLLLFLYTMCWSSYIGTTAKVLDDIDDRDDRDDRDDIDDIDDIDAALVVLIGIVAYK